MTADARAAASVREAPRPAALQRAAPALVYALYAVGVPLAAHLLFSRYGFNPTDDGFVLAYARRMLDGEIPHRDFIAVHLAGSGLIHMPFVAFGGGSLYLLSRLFVWAELAWASLAWTLLASRLLALPRNLVLEVATALIAFAFSAHYFPAMAWHTIDGLCLVAIGALLASHETRAAKLAGYFLIGFAIICKQNYLPVAPAAILLLGDGRRGLAWVAAAAPLALYMLVVVAAGGAGDAWIQLTTQTGLLQTGLLKYLWESAAGWGALAGFVLALLLLRARGADAPRLSREAWAALAGLLFLFVEAALALAQGQFLSAPAFGLFGLGAGATIYVLLEKPDARALAALGLLSTLVAWCSSISIGYNSPALGSGFPAIFLVGLARASFPELKPAAGRLLAMGVAATAAFVLVEFAVARTQFVYLERPAAQLTARLDGVLPGGDGLYADPNTYAFLKDLQDARRLAPGRYALLPDMAGYWPAADEANPLPSDWPQWFELGKPQLVAREIGAIERQRGQLSVIVQKVRAASLARGFLPLADGDFYAAATYVRHHLTKVGETRYFEVYR